MRASLGLRLLRGSHLDAFLGSESSLRALDANLGRLILLLAHPVCQLVYRFCLT